MAETKRIAVAAALLFLSISIFAQERQKFEYKWDTVPIDDRWDFITDSTATRMIAAYDSVLAPLREVLVRSDKRYDRNRPESALSDFVADALRKGAEKVDGHHVDIALTNFGGIRTNLPEGDVTMYDVLSMFPFHNFVVVFEISGKDFYCLMREHAERPEVMSGVRLVVDEGKVASVEVGGAPLDTTRTYTMASINFLMSGGDYWTLDTYARGKREYPDYLIRDAIVDALKEVALKGEILSLEKDGRTIIK